MKNKSLNNNKNIKKGISLIVLIITIIVIIIISSSVILSLNNTNIIDSANEAKIKTDLTNFKEELQLYMLDKQLENPNFSGISLNSGKNGLMYNTKNNGETGNIKDVMKTIDDKYIDKIEIIKGELVINTTDTKEVKAAKDLGIKVNPYDIKDGELLSTENNLLLMDSNGVVTIPSSITSIGSGAFRKVDGLKTIVIPGSVKKIGAYAFSGNDTLENVILGEGIEEIGNYAFESCRNLRTIHLADSINKIGSSCFANCISLKDFNFPKNLKVISNNMFKNCFSIYEVKIPEGIEKLDWSCFSNCINLNKINIPKSCNYIHGHSFIGIPNLKNIDINFENPNFIYEDGMIMSKSKDVLYCILGYKKDLIIPNSIKILSEGALIGNSNIREYHFSENIEKIYTNFRDVVRKIDVDINNKNYKSINGNLYDYKGETLIKYCSNEEIVNLPEGLKLIKWEAFSGQDNVKMLNLPETLESIEHYSLSGSNKDIYFGKNLKYINPIAFAGNNMNITISNENPYYKCEDSMSILSKDGKKLCGVAKSPNDYIIPESVEIIIKDVFYNRYYIKNIKLNNNLKRIEQNSFAYLPRLTKIEIPSSVEHISNDTFIGCDNLTDIIIDKKEDEIKGAAWGAPYGLRAVKWKK